jgi:hypothetical protein
MGAVLLGPFGDDLDQAGFALHRFLEAAIEQMAAERMQGQAEVALEMA